MVRIQVQLEQARHRQLKRRARQLGVSVSEVIRRSVDAALDREADGPDPRVRRALAAAGRYADSAGARQTARDHDAALDEAFHHGRLR
jgi:post-segregation antitoxin (ccd killing protein)